MKYRKYSRSIYIFSGAGSDQIVGRAVCSLPIQSMDFAILPPHFSNEDVEMISNVIGWGNILEHYTNYPNGFKKSHSLSISNYYLSLSFRISY